MKRPRVTADDWKFIAGRLLPEGDYEAILRQVIARAARRNLRGSKVAARRRANNGGGR